MTSAATKQRPPLSRKSFSENAPMRTVSYLDQLLQKPERGLLHGFEIICKDGTSLNIPARTKWSRRLDFTSELKPQIVNAVNEKGSVKIFMNMERSEGAPLEKVFVARYSHRVLIALGQIAPSRIDRVNKALNGKPANGI